MSAEWEQIELGGVAPPTDRPATYRITYCGTHILVIWERGDEPRRGWTLDLASFTWRPIPKINDWPPLDAAETTGANSKAYFFVWKDKQIYELDLLTNSARPLPQSGDKPNIDWLRRMIYWNDHLVCFLLESDNEGRTNRKMNQIWKYSLKEGRWQTIPVTGTMCPLDPDTEAVPIRGNDAYFIGVMGGDDRGPLKCSANFLKFDLQNGRWDVGFRAGERDFPSPKMASGAAWVGDRFYVFGGHFGPRQYAGDFWVLGPSKSGASEASGDTPFHPQAPPRDFPLPEGMIRAPGAFPLGSKRSISLKVEFRYDSKDEGSDHTRILFRGFIEPNSDSRGMTLKLDLETVEREGTRVESPVEPGKKFSLRFNKAKGIVEAQGLKDTFDRIQAERLMRTPIEAVVQTTGIIQWNTRAATDSDNPVSRYLPGAFGPILPERAGKDWMDNFYVGREPVIFSNSVEGETSLQGTKCLKIASRLVEEGFLKGSRESYFSLEHKLFIRDKVQVRFGDKEEGFLEAITLELEFQ